jgi:hypothetical protein
MYPYQLIACSFHDELEALATLRQTCEIQYRQTDGAVHMVTSKIIDVYSRDGLGPAYGRLRQREGQRLPHQSSNPLPQGVVEPLNVARQTTLFAHSTVALTNNCLVGFPVVRPGHIVGTQAVATAIGQGLRL